MPLGTGKPADFVKGAGQTTECGDDESGIPAWGNKYGIFHTWKNRWYTVCLYMNGSLSIYRFESNMVLPGTQTR
jgi:hypothetical protein